MMCMWEHIDRTNLLHVVLHAKQAQIAGLCCRVTTYINDTPRFGEKDGVDYNSVLSILFKAELTLASSIASGTYSMPITFLAWRETKLAIVPVPV